MKKYLVFLIVLINISISSQSQQDLYTLANGKCIGFDALFDEEKNLYGYVAIYDLGKSENKTKRLEYVVLDKNLNPFANKEFEGDITAQDYSGTIDFRKKLILVPTPNYYAVSYKNFFLPRSKEINLADNSIKNKVNYIYKDGNFSEIIRIKTEKEKEQELEKERKEKGYNYVSAIREIKEGGYLIEEYDYDSKKYTFKNYHLLRFDENKNKLWQLDSDYFVIICTDEKYIYSIKKNNDEKKLLFIDINSGKIIHQEPITGLTDETIDYLRYHKLKKIDDKIILSAFNYGKDIHNYNGFVRTIIDRNNFKIESKVIYFTDFQKYIPNIKEKGKVENGHELVSRDRYILNDGSIGIIFEKYKSESKYNASNTTDLVYAFTDKDFNLKEVKVFKKEKTIWETNSDYLFSQYLNNGKDVVFFYRDLQKDEKTKEKNWNLFINTLIDGQFKQEKVQISEKDNYTIIPYVGKEGYILLREFNEKEKFNKIRLERLNY